MDVFHLFEHLKADDMTEIVKAIHAINTFEELVAYIKETLTKFFGQYRMNENVVSVLEVIGRDYQKELSLKDISKDLFINPVYLGQLIKGKPTQPLRNCSINSELRQRSNSYFRPVIVSKIFAMQLAIVMLDISIRFSVNCAENHRKLIGNKLKPACKSCIPVQKCYNVQNILWRKT